MENFRYSVIINGTILYFDGCELVDIEYEESLDEPEFEYNWFIDAYGDRIEIDAYEEERHPYDNSDKPLHAHIKIDGRTVQTLEIFEYANGTVYLKPESEF